MAAEYAVEIVVRVTVLPSREDPTSLALEMVKEALAHRPPSWLRTTFVSEGDVFVLRAAGGQ
jgi:hypothetical protein